MATDELNFVVRVRTDHIDEVKALGAQAQRLKHMEELTALAESEAEVWEMKGKPAKGEPGYQHLYAAQLLNAVVRRWHAVDKNRANNQSE